MRHTIYKVTGKASYLAEDSGLCSARRVPRDEGARRRLQCSTKETLLMRAIDKQAHYRNSTSWSVNQRRTLVIVRVFFISPPEILRFITPLRAALVLALRYHRASPAGSS